MKSCVPMLTTVHPIALAELRQSVWFSFLSHGLSNLFVLIARSSIVPGTATLISLLQQHVKFFSNKISMNNRNIKLGEWKCVVPKKNTVFCNFEELVGRRINRKIFLEKLILWKIVIYMCNIWWFLRFTYCVKQCSSSCL